MFQFGFIDFARGKNRFKHKKTDLNLKLKQKNNNI